MQVKFSARFIKLTFDQNEEFSGRSLKMAGEPLDNGFDADGATMQWFPPHDGEAIDASARERIKDMIADRNQTHAFKILFMGEGHV